VPVTNLPVAIPPKVPVIDPHNGRPAAQSAWAKSIEKVNNKQVELKQRAAATTEWGSVVEKLSSGSESRGIGKDGWEAAQPTHGAPCEDG
jgi:hypothetical protein